MDSASHFFRTVFAIAVWVLISSLPLLLVGLSFEQTARQALESVGQQPSKVLLVSFILLASDILLPIPSSFVCTVCGQVASWMMATVVCASGMFLGSTIGFVLSRIWGRRLAERLSSPEHLTMLDAQISSVGVWWLIALRPLPILAESAVLLCGVHRMSWPQFAIGLGTSSLITSGAFALLGALSKTGNWNVLAWIASVVVPLLVMLVIRRRIG